ncbi:MAG: TatD family hydrolase [Nitrososphaerota archaeon]
MIDVHCHLTEEVLARDLENVLRDAREAGIKAIVTSGTSYADCNNVLEVADNRYIYASLGLMPYYSESPQTVAELI